MKFKIEIIFFTPKTVYLVHFVPFFFSGKRENELASCTKLSYWESKLDEIYVQMFERKQ